MNAAGQQGSEIASQRGPRTRNYRDLFAWQKAMALVRAVYLLTERFPPDERFGLTSQMRRSAVSVPSNIAEGHGRLSDRAMRMFLGNACGSLYELETQALLSADMNFANRDDVDALLAQSGEVARILNGLLRTLEVED